jgi:hypothetical protein
MLVKSVDDDDDHIPYDLYVERCLVKYDQKARRMTARQLNNEDDDSIVDAESASMSCKI